MELKEDKVFKTLEDLKNKRWELFGANIIIEFKYSDIPEELAIALKMQNNRVRQNTEYKVNN